jgi:hypothetical protein
MSSSFHETSDRKGDDSDDADIADDSNTNNDDDDNKNISPFSAPDELFMRLTVKGGLCPYQTPTSTKGGAGAGAGAGMRPKLPKGIMDRFPYSYSKVQHAVRLPFTFSMGPKTWPELFGNKSNQKNPALKEGSPIRIHITRAEIEKKWGSFMRLLPNSYHLVPIEVHMREVDSRHLPIRLACRLLSYEPNPVGDSVNNVGIGDARTWTKSTRVVSGVDWNVPDAIVPACLYGASPGIMPNTTQPPLSGDHPIWKANTDIVNNDLFQRLKIFDLPAFGKTTGMIQVRDKGRLHLEYPVDKKLIIKDGLVWYMALNEQHVAEQVNSTRGASVDESFEETEQGDTGSGDDGGGSDDEEEEDPQQQQQGGQQSGSDEEDEQDTAQSSDNFGRGKIQASMVVMRMKDQKVQKIVNKIQKWVNPAQNLMSLDQGLTLEVVPAEHGGWDRLRDFHQTMSSSSDQNVTIKPFEWNPCVHLNVTVDITAIPIVASPVGSPVYTDSAIPVGFVARNSETWVGQK